MGGEYNEFRAHYELVMTVQTLHTVTPQVTGRILNSMSHPEHVRKHLGGLSVEEIHIQRLIGWLKGLGVCIRYSRNIKEYILSVQS